MGFWKPNRPASPPASEPSFLSAGSYLEPAAEEAEEQFLNKQAKLRTALGAVVLQQFQQIAQDEMTDVRRLKAKHLKGEWAADAAPSAVTDMGNIIICDDYRHNEPPPPRPISREQGGLPGWLVALLVILLVVALALAGIAVYKAFAGPAPSVNTNVREGFSLELVPPKAEKQP